MPDKDSTIVANQKKPTCTPSGHCVQYAIIYTPRMMTILGTEDMTNEEVRQYARTSAFVRVHKDDKIERYNRCPKCEAWTRDGNRWRRELRKACPAIAKKLLDAKTMEVIGDV